MIFIWRHTSIHERGQYACRGHTPSLGNTLLPEENSIPRALRMLWLHQDGFFTYTCDHMVYHGHSS